MSSAAAGFDAQGEKDDATRVAAAMRGFLRDLGATGALHLDACVRCGQCAQACHFHTTTGDAKYTPYGKPGPAHRTCADEAAVRAGATY